MLRSNLKNTLGYNVNISDYGNSISVEYTEDDFAKQAKIQTAFDKCMENAHKTKEGMAMQTIEKFKVTDNKRPGDTVDIKGEKWGV